ACAGVRSIRKYWMSSSSNMGPLRTRSRRPLLHVVEDIRKVALHRQRLLDLGRGDEWILPVFEEAGTLVRAEIGDERGDVGLPVSREPLELLEDRVDAGAGEEGDGVLGVLVEVRVEDALVHEIRVRTDVEEDPPQVVELERRQHARVVGHRLLEPAPV